MTGRQPRNSPRRPPASAHQPVGTPEPHGPPDRPGGARHRGADALLARAEALHWFLDAVDGVAPRQRVGPAQAIVTRAHERLRLSRGHTVVALAGPTGGGKSSLFNAVARLELSAVGVRRPTTSLAQACVWGTDNSAALLDWLGIPEERRFARESALDAEDEAPLRGLVLLDLPDFDSIADAHRIEVDRLLALVDLVVWVTDPQKYADKVVHGRYLSTFHGHRDVMVVVLNQADRLSPADTAHCVADLRRLLESGGLAGVPVFATSAVDAPPGVGELRGVLEKAVGTRQAALRRLDDDLTEVIADLRGMIGADPADQGAEEALIGSLVEAAGVDGVAEGAARAYRHRAGRSLRWLPALPPWRRRFDAVGAVPVEAATVALAVREFGQRVGAGLPEPWPRAIEQAARSDLPDLPATLDRALARTDLGAARTPWWWRLTTVVQWLLTLIALAGIVWWAVGRLAPALNAHLPRQPRVGPVPAGALLAAGALLVGALLQLLLLPLAVSAAGVVQEQARRRLRGRVFEVTRQHVVEPVRGLLRRYVRAKAALSAAVNADSDDTGDPPPAPRGAPAGSTAGPRHAGR